MAKNTTAKKIATEKIEQTAQEEKAVRIRALSEFKDEEAMDLLADLLLPVSNIITDIQSAVSKNEPMAVLARDIIKKHKKDVLEVLGLLADGEYHCTPVSLLRDVLAIMNDKEIMHFFSEQGVDFTAALSGASSVIGQAEE